MKLPSVFQFFNRKKSVVEPDECQDSQIPYVIIEKRSSGFIIRFPQQSKGGLSERSYLFTPIRSSRPHMHFVLMVRYLIELWGLESDSNDFKVHIGHKKNNHKG